MAAQAVPHAPQLAGSDWVSRQLPLQLVRPAEHTQAPLLQICPTAQGVAQVLAALPPTLGVPAVELVPAIALAPAAVLAPARPEGAPALPGEPAVAAGDSLLVEGAEHAATPARTPMNTKIPRWIERRMLLSEWLPAESCVPHS